MVSSQCHMASVAASHRILLRWTCLGLILLAWRQPALDAFVNTVTLGRSCYTALNAREGPKKATPQEPWKPLVFKMPQKKQPRTLEPGDDDFTMKMRDRLKSLKLKEDDQPDDLVTVSAENAKNLALSAMWYIDQEADRVKEEKKNPDIHVLRKRYNGALDKLIVPPEKPAEPAGSEESGESGGLEIPAALDMDAMFERAAPRRRREKRPKGEDAEEEDEGIADYLISMQKLSSRRLLENQPTKARSKRSPEERRQEYEDTKVRMFAFTAAIGSLGTGFSMLMYGVNVAFSFGLGAVGGLSYLSGLASYTDNAENAMGALGARRLLTPVVVLLIVQGWPRIEAQVPEIAALQLEPSLLPAILGFFTYTVGKVLAGVLK